MVDDQIPTSALLEIKIGDAIGQDAVHGRVAKIEIQETDEFLQFLFDIESGEQIVVRKLKQVC